MINPVIPFEKLVLLTLVLVPLAGMLAWRSSAAASRRLRLGLTALRVAGVLLVAVVAFNPGARRRRAEAESHHWALLLDHSASMQRDDAGAGTRLAAGRRIARAALGQSEDASRVRAAAFAATLRGADDGFAQVAPAAGNTDIIGCCRSVLAEFAGTGRLRGVLLLTDGRQVDAAAPDTLAAHARAQGTPVYAVALGGPVARRDLRIWSPRRQYVAFKGQTVRLDARVEGSGFTPMVLQVALLDRDGTPLAEQKLEWGPPDGAQTHVAALSFETEPLPPGRHVCTLTLPVQPGEHAGWNNRDTFEIAVLERPVATLHVEGLPYWDSKFLMQLLRRQPNLSVTSIYRVGEGRFFAVEDDLQDARPLEDRVFPGSLEELGRYDLVILGKGCEYVLDPDALRALRGFVRDLGGALVFSRGKPYHGTLPGLEPLEAGRWGSSVTSDLHLRPTAAGEDAGLFGRLLPARDAAVWQSLPPIRHAHTLTWMNSFTRVLASAELGSGGAVREIPLIASRRYGKGMIVTVNADGIWQWGFIPSVEAAGEVYNELWTQLLNWTVTYGEFLPGENLALRLSRTTIAAGGASHVQVHHRPTAAEVPQPEVYILRAGERIGTCPLTPRPDAPLSWDGVVRLTQPGSYRVRVDAGGEPGPEQTLTVLPEPDEQSNESADPDFLARLCESTGGRLVQPDEIAALVREFERAPEQVEEAEARWDPWWDHPLYLLALFLPFSIEWFLRRRHGLI